MVESLKLSTSYRSGLKCQDYTQVVINVKIIYKWLKSSHINILKKRLKFKDVNIIHHWLKMSKLDSSG